MKAFIIGVITLSILLSAVTVNSFFVAHRTDELLSEINSLPENAAEADISNIQGKWKSMRKWISLTVHRKNIDSIDDTIVLLSIEIDSENDGGYLREKARLLTIIERLRKTETFSLSRIF